MQVPSSWGSMVPLERQPLDAFSPVEHHSMRRLPGRDPTGDLHLRFGSERRDRRSPGPLLDGVRHVPRRDPRPRRHCPPHRLDVADHLDRQINHSSCVRHPHSLPVNDGGCTRASGRLITANHERHVAPGGTDTTHRPFF